jgi:hypothetical protein
VARTAIIAESFAARESLRVYGALVIPPSVPDHWQYWFWPVT